VLIDGRAYPTSEHYFQASKFNGPYHQKIQNAKTPSEAAKLGRDRRKPLRNDWEEVKDSIMETAVFHKFTQNPLLQEMLKSTHPKFLVEHTRNDRYWGDGGDGSGKNKLGEILQKVRSVLIDLPVPSPEANDIPADLPSPFRLISERVPARNSVQRLSLDSITGIKNALREDGVCIISNVASKQELEVGEGLFWEWAESLPFGFDRNDLNSLKDDWELLGFRNTGVISNFGIGQSEFMWYCRQLPGVLEVFRNIWDTTDLVTSFDGCSTFRNIWWNGLNSKWLTKGGWFHVDQNGNRNKKLETYQGLLNFFPATPSTGSTVVVCGSHKKFAEIFDGSRQPCSDFVPLSNQDDYVRHCLNAEQVVLEEGDFLVWDSRVIHCSQGIDSSHPQADAMPGRERETLARLVAYICMIPARNLCPFKKKQEDLRAEYVRAGATSGHNPCLRKKPTRLELPHFKIPSRSLKKIVQFGTLFMVAPTHTSYQKKTPAQLKK